ncbi:MAG: von Willebrand factor type A domain-containing protein [Candidatus Cloacimonetes bacterium]|nr:von Willebrand factor type A domain-containing protein [Candidatus Cloacimonadota bacterium]
MKKICLITILALVLMPLLFARAEALGRISLRVRDTKGNAVPDAVIAVYQGKTMITEVKTSDKGIALVKDLKPGTYELIVSKAGYMQFKQDNVVVVGDQAIPINVVLKTKPEEHTLKQPTSPGAPEVYDSSNLYNSMLKGKIGSATTSAYQYEGYPPSDTNEFAAINPNTFQRADASPLSTFSIDVDTGCYSLVRKWLNSNELPPANMIRTEELLNYFSYDYPQPKDKHPFAIYTELGTNPWNEKRQLVHIGLKGKELDLEETPPSNLVFLIDVSGSMESSNKLPLVLQSLDMLVDNLREQDKISIVVYAGAAGTVLEPTYGSEKGKIKKALAALRAGGSTAGGAGIALAYQTAHNSFIRGGNNRIILCTDGDFNVGVSSTAHLIEMVEKEKESGIFLSVLGFGMGNYKDNRMEQIANKGNGNYAYIDTILEAKKVFVNEMTSTLFTIAKDVKIQVEFNPALVKAYRLIGYENRMLRTEDFRDDTKDAGELGAGHTVTAIYEIIPAGSDEKLPEVDSLRYQSTSKLTSASKADELLTVKLRYKLPDSDTSIPLESPLLSKVIPWDKTSDNFRFSSAVVMYSMLLQDSEFKGSSSWDLVKKLAQNSLGKDEYGYRNEFMNLVKIAELLKTSRKNFED